jgi:HAD superfamily hydrolase (TIGR01509 family)
VVEAGPRDEMNGEEWMGMIKGLIFDFDGLILDTEGPDFESWREMYRTHGQELQFSAWSPSIGTSSDSFDPHSHLEELLGTPLDRESVRSARRRRYLEMVESNSILPGIAEYLEAAAELGLRLAVASSATRDWVDGHLTRLGLFNFFACTHCGDDVEIVKPDPTLYRKALAALEIQPHEAIAFEDSPNGARAAKAAGIFCVAVPNPLTRELPLEMADLRLESLAEMPLPDLVRFVEQRTLQSG